MQKQIETIRKASRQIVREFGLLSSKCGQTDVGYAEGHALLEIETFGRLTAGELSVILNLNRSSTARTLNKLKAKRWVAEVPDQSDAKKKPVELTREGRKKVSQIHFYSDSRVARALGYLDKDAVKTITDAMHEYARALKLSRVEEAYTIRRILEKDNTAIKKIVKTVSKEFNTCGEGGPTVDVELNDMYQAYSKKSAAYYVVADKTRVLGGAGFGPLPFEKKDVCEFRKMYLLPRARGRGLGELLMRKCIQQAKESGYRKMYLETVDRMIQAVALYKKFGASEVAEPLGQTGHCQCEKKMVIYL